MKKILYICFIPLLLIGCDDNYEGTSVNSISADFTASRTTLPTGTSTIFNVQSENTDGEFLWEFEGGEPEVTAGLSPEVSYSTPGTYGVKLTVVNGANSGSVVKEGFVTVVEALNVDFSVDQTEVQTGTLVQFTDLTTGGGNNSWSWTFEGGTPSTSTSQNPAVTYSTPGNYAVTLQVSNGDVETATYTMETAVKVSSCPVLSGTYYAYTLNEDNPFDPLVYEVQIALEEDGSYYLSDLTGGAYEIVWGDAPNPGILSETSCGVFEINDQPDTTYGGGVITGSGSTNVDGSFTLSWESSAYGDFGTTTYYKSGEGYLNADFVSYDYPINEGGTADFFHAAIGDGISFAWEFPGGSPATSAEANPSVAYETAGEYDVTLTITDENGNSVTETKSAYILVEPADCADLSGEFIAVTSGCLGDGDGNCFPGDEFSNLITDMTLTSNGDGTYQISDITGGTYLAFYNNGGAAAITIEETECGSFIFTDVEDPFYPDVFNGSGTYDPTNGTITYSWTNGWGDQGVTTLVPKSGGSSGRNSGAKLARAARGLNNPELMKVIKTGKLPTYSFIKKAK